MRCPTVGCAAEPRHRAWCNAVQLHERLNGDEGVGRQGVDIRVAHDALQARNKGLKRRAPWPESTDHLREPPLRFGAADRDSVQRSIANMAHHSEACDYSKPEK